MKLFIRNMVCNRCKEIIRQQLELLCIDYKSIELGEVTLNKAIPTQEFVMLKEQLHKLGFELLTDYKASVVTQIKSAIINFIHCGDGTGMNKKLSVMLAEKLSADYDCLSALFSSVEGLTVEQYIILQRIEKAKELLTYNEASLSQIADELGYSSVQHLSQQFKKVTGLTPSQFKNSKEISRKPLDEVGV